MRTERDPAADPPRWLALYVLQKRLWKRSGNPRPRHTGVFFVRGPLVAKAQASPLARRQYVAIHYRLETLNTRNGLATRPLVESIEILGDPKTPPVLPVDELRAEDFL